MQKVYKRNVDALSFQAHRLTIVILYLEFVSTMHGLAGNDGASQIDELGDKIYNFDVDELDDILFKMRNVPRL